MLEPLEDPELPELEPEPMLPELEPEPVDGVEGDVVDGEVLELPLPLAPLG